MKSLPLFCTLLLTLGIGLFVHINSTLNHDIGWYLLSGEKFLNGGTLYKDIFVEVNPPLGFYMTLPAAFIAKLTGWFSVDVFMMYMYALISLSLILTYSMLSRIQDLSDKTKSGFMIFFALALTFYTTEGFGQREHMLVLFGMPYILLTVIRIENKEDINKALAVFIGALAGIGFAIKPFYLLVPAALELYRLIITKDVLRTFRSETLAGATVVLTYLASIFIFTPEYINTIIPYALETYQQAYSKPYWILMLRPEFIFMLPVTAIYYLVRKEHASKILLDCLMLCAACFFITYSIQSKGWHYHVYPMSVCMALGLICISLQFFSRTKDFVQQKSQLRTCAQMALLFVFTLFIVNINQGLYENKFVGPVPPYIDKYAAENKSLYVFGTNVWPAFPLVNYNDLRWESRFPTLWMLPGLIQKRAINENAPIDEIENYVRESVIEDFTNHPPGIVILDVRERKSYYAGVDFDYIDYFSTDPRFAKVWAGYKKVPDFGKLKGFDLYYQE